MVSLNEPRRGQTFNVLEFLDNISIFFNMLEFVDCIFIILPRLHVNRRNTKNMEIDES